MKSENTRRRIFLKFLKPTSRTAMEVQPGEKEISYERMAAMVGCEPDVLADYLDVYYHMGNPNGSVLTAKGLLNWYRTLTIPASIQEVKVGLDESSADGETLDFYEFAVLMQTKTTADEERKELKEVFGVLDEDEDGEVGLTDISQAVTKTFNEPFTEQQAREALQSASKSGAPLTFDEFYLFVKGGAKQPVNQEQPSKEPLKGGADMSATKPQG